MAYNEVLASAFQQLIDKDAEIAALKQQLAEAEKVCDSYAAENQRLHDRAEAAEAANKRLRAETIEECVHAVKAKVTTSHWVTVDVIIEALRALASETAGGGSE